MNIIKRFKQDLSPLKQLWSFFENLKPLIYLSIALGFLSSFVESIAVGLIVLFIFKSLSVTQPFPESGILTNFLSAIDYITDNSFVMIWVMVVLIIILKSIILGGYQLLSDHITNTIHHRIRSALFDKYMCLPYTVLSKMDQGSMINALYVECWYVSEALKSLSGVVIALCAITVYLVIIMFFSWPLALFIIVLGLVIKILLSGLKQPLRKISHDVTKINEELSLQISSRMQALKAFRARAIEQREMSTFRLLSKRVASAFTKMSLVGVYITPINDAALLLVVGALIAFSTYIGNPVTVTATTIALLYRLKPYVYALEGALMTLVRSQGPMAAVLKQLSTEDIRSKEHLADKPLPENWRVIQFDDVSFSYEQENVIENLSFCLKKGKVLGVKGESGAGKSTVVNMFLKLIEPTSGKILLDDENFAEVKRQQWLSTVGAAGQDFELVDASVSENITLGQDISDDAIWQALEIAEIAELVKTLPHGLDTRIGERGVMLSGGQRQRLVLARAIACAPEVLIMDEATSALDYETEEKIYSNIKRSLPDLTIILITHRAMPSDFIDVSVDVKSKK